MSCDCLSICQSSNNNLRSVVSSYQAFYPGLIAQLTSVDYVMLLNDKTTKVGRTISSAKSVGFPAGSNTRISRKHFSLKYDSDGNFTLLCLSKNGIVIDETFCRKRDQPYILPQHCIIRFPSTDTVIHFKSLINESPALPVTDVDNMQHFLSSDIYDIGTANLNSIKIVSSLPADETEKRPVSSDRPPYSYSQLIVQAIHESPQKMLPLCKIYSFIMENYPYYRKFAIKSWQNSIRHNLSMKAYFVKTPQQEPKIGHLWMIRPSCEALLVSKRFQERSNRSKPMSDE